MTKEKFKMAKKKLILNESVTRRFMKLATIKPTYVSNFLAEAKHEEEKEEDEKVMKEQEEEDEEMEMDMGGEEPEMDMGGEEPEMDMDMETEDEMEADSAAEAESVIMDLMKHIEEFAKEKGVTLSIEGDDDAGDEEEGMEMDAELEGGEDELADEEEMPEDAEANYGNRETMQEEIDADLEAAGVSVVDEEAIVAEVTRRVARRLLRESAKRK